MYCVIFHFYEKSDKVIVSCTSCQSNFQLYFLLQISHLKISKHSAYQCIFITARQRSGEGNVFSCVCLLVHRGFHHTGLQPWFPPHCTSPQLLSNLTGSRFSPIPGPCTCTGLQPFPPQTCSNLFTM